MVTEPDTSNPENVIVWQSVPSTAQVDGSGGGAGGCGALEVAAATSVEDVAVVEDAVGGAARTEVVASTLEVVASVVVSSSANAFVAIAEKNAAVNARTSEASEKTGAPLIDVVVPLASAGAASPGVVEDVPGVAGGSPGAGAAVSSDAGVVVGVVSCGALELAAWVDVASLPSPDELGVEVASSDGVDDALPESVDVAVGCEGAGGCSVTGAGPAPETPVDPLLTGVVIETEAELSLVKLENGASPGRSCASALSGSFHPTAITCVGKMWTRFCSLNASAYHVVDQSAYAAMAARYATSSQRIRALRREVMVKTGLLGKLLSSPYCSVIFGLFRSSDVN